MLVFREDKHLCLLLYNLFTAGSQNKYCLSNANHGMHKSGENVDNCVFCYSPHAQEHRLCILSLSMGL